MQKITVFQENGSGNSKIAGIKRFGNNNFSIEIIDINLPLPFIIDDASKYLPLNLNTDLVLDFLKHPDLSTDLALLCQKKKIPIIASGKKITLGQAFTPLT